MIKLMELITFSYYIINTIYNDLNYSYKILISKITWNLLFSNKTLSYIRQIYCTSSADLTTERHSITKNSADSLDLLQCIPSSLRSVIRDNGFAFHLCSRSSLQSAKSTNPIRKINPRKRFVRRLWFIPAHFSSADSTPHREIQFIIIKSSYYTPPVHP